MPFSDPFSSNDLATYRIVRDEIEAQVVGYLSQLA
jgi:hypothetical protein